MCEDVTNAKETTKEERRAKQEKESREEIAPIGFKSSPRFVRTVFVLPSFEMIWWTASNVKDKRLTALWKSKMVK